MISDIVIAKLGSTTGIANKVPVRPINLSPIDRRPWIVVDSFARPDSVGLVTDTGWYIGEVAVTVAADKHSECNALVNLVAYSLALFTGANASYAIRHCVESNRDEISQTEDADGKPYYAAVISFNVNIERIGSI